jgi:hypothetical protein
VFSLVSADIVDGVGTLLMAELDGEPVGCGAFRWDDAPGSAEIERLHVTLAGRGKKIGSALLAELERAAAAIGVRRDALEFGPRQPGGRRMFEPAGYAVCDPSGSFVGKDLSIHMAKHLADRATGTSVQPQTSSSVDEGNTSSASPVTRYAIERSFDNQGDGHPADSRCRGTNRGYSTFVLRTYV